MADGPCLQTVNQKDLLMDDNQLAHENDPPTPSVLLIDLENCPSQIQQLHEHLDEFSQVIICYAHSGAKIPLDWLMPLSSAVSANKLKIFKLASTGKNAADFGICFFAGILTQQLPEDTHFVIASNDTDLDHAVSLLKSQNRSAERIGTKGKPAASPADESLSSVAKYCAHLVTYSKNRPAKEDTLRNSIKNKFKDSPETASLVYKTLIEQGAVAISGTKVSYNDKKIKELS